MISQVVHVLRLKHDQSCWIRWTAPSLTAPCKSEKDRIAIFRENAAKTSLPWKVIPTEELLTKGFLARSRAGHGLFSNLRGLEYILAVVTRMAMPLQPRRIKPALNIAGCLALLHAIHLAKPQMTRRRKI